MVKDKKQEEKVYCSGYDDSLPELSRRMAITCLVINCLPATPGIGTLISACAGKSFNWKPLLIGFLQGMLAVVVVGHIWSLVHGVWLLEKHYAKLNECFDCGRRKALQKEIEKTEEENRKIPAHEQIEANIKF